MAASPSPKCYNRAYSARLSFRKESGLSLTWCSKILCTVLWGYTVMQINPRAYPHPVLAHWGDDILDSTFQGVVSGKGAKNAYVFDAVFKTNNADLLTLVEQKKAMYAVHVECNSTRYRNLFKSAAEKFSFEIGAGLIDGRVEVCSFVLAAKPIDKYTNASFHPDYGKSIFRLSRGDTLAVAHDQIIEATKKNDPLRKIGSIFSIVPNDDEKATGMDIETDGPKVIVRLSKPNFESYISLRHSADYRSVLIGSIVVPALVEVLERIRRAADEGELEDYSDFRWFVVIDRKLRERNIRLQEDPESFVDSSLKVAHELLGQPLSLSLNGLRAMTGVDE